MSYDTNKTIQTVKLSQPFEPEHFKVKRKFKALPGALAYFAIMVVVFVALAYVGDAFHILTFGEGVHAANPLGFVGGIFFFVGLARVAKTIDAINEERSDEQKYRRYQYSRDVLMPVIKRTVPDVGSFADLMAEKLISEREAGMWSRIKGTNDGNVYQFTIKDDVLTITSYVQVSEDTDEYAGLR